MNELKTRGINDVLIAVVDGLKGFPEAIGTVFPLTTVQTCIIHLIRNSLAFVSWKDRRLIMPDVKAIYRAETAEAAAAELDNFEARWGKRYPPGLAAGLELCGAAVRVPGGDPQDDLHHERRGEPASVLAQDHQDPRQLPDRRGGAEAAVPGDPQRRRRLAPTS
jgi:putative transposase